MSPDDCNYPLMEEKRTIYMNKLLHEAKEKNFQVTAFEQEEIESAFEAGFASGFNQGAKRRGRSRFRDGYGAKLD